MARVLVVWSARVVLAAAVALVFAHTLAMTR